MTKFYLFLFSIVCLSVNSQNIVIPDPVLKQAIIAGDFFGNSPDADGDGEISIAESVNVYDVYYHNPTGMGPHILSLEGIQNFPYLYSVNISDGGNFSADFTALNTVTNITDLRLYGGFSVGSYFDLSNLTMLTQVHLSINTTGTTIDLTGMTSSISGNMMVYINSNFADVLFNNIFIDYVDFSGSGLTSVNLTTFSTYDLNLQNNQLTSIDFTQASFQSVNLSNNPFQTLDLTGLGDNIYINCTDLPNLEVLKISPTMTEMNNLWIENCPNLTVMDFKNNADNLGEMAGIYVRGIPQTVQTVCVDPMEYSGFFYEMDHCGTEACGLGGSGCYSCQHPNTSLTQYCNFTTDINMISGNVTLDCGGANYAMGNINILATGGSYPAQTYTSTVGNYHVYGGQNTNINVTPQLSNPSYFTVTPPNFAFNFPNGGNNGVANFCLSANGVHPDVSVTVIPVSPARPGFNATYNIIFENKGNQTLSGNITLNFDDAVLDFVSAAPNVDQQTLNTLSWDYTNLHPFETRYITFILNVNSPVETPPVNIGDQLSFEVAITPLANDETPADNFMECKQTVVGSMDPNEKEVLEGSQVYIGDADEYLHYIVRFQNMGTYMAENVVIADNIDSYNLDLNTFEILSASHDYRATLTNGNFLEVFYEGINLPALSEDEPGSHGYVAYRIKPKNTVSIGSTIYNSASIYFDYNMPIVTNSVTTTFTALTAEEHAYQNSFSIHPNPADNTLNVSALNGNSLTNIIIYNTLGQIVHKAETDSMQSAYSVNISALNSGTYFITLTTSQGKITKRFLKN